MLVAMVKSCAAWMRAGLPLKLLKIVCFVPEKGKLSSPKNDMISEVFAQLKPILETVEDAREVCTLYSTCIWLPLKIET